jgi:exopolysaccharide production protein ExoQ
MAASLPALRRTPPAPATPSPDAAASTATQAWASLVAGAATLLATSAFLRFVQPDRPGFADGDVRLQVIWFALYAAAGVILAARLLSRRPLALPDPFLCGFVALALASTVWSANPEVTAKRSLALVGTAAVGTLLASEWRFESMLRLLRWVLAVAGVASLAIAVAHLLIASPATHNPAFDEGLRGVFFHKNGLGRAMALGVLTVALQCFLRGRAHRSDLLLVLMFATLVVLSRSATAIVLTALTVAILLTLPALVRPGLHMTLVGAGFVAAGALVAVVGLAGVGLDDVARLLGRDPSLTGRIGVWAAAADSIRDHAWLGHGFAGFWVEGYWPAAMVARLARFPDVTQGHNGYLDILLQLGLVGLAVAVGSFALTGHRIWLRLRAGEDRAAAAMAALMAFVLTANLTESSFQQHSFSMMVLFAVSAAAARRTRETSLAETPPASVPHQA